LRIALLAEISEISNAQRVREADAILIAPGQPKAQCGVTGASDPLSRVAAKEGLSG
jgi:hypothetical protein